MANKVNFGVTGTSGDYFGTPATLSVSASSTQVITQKGYYYVLPDTNGTLQMNVSSTWTNMGAAGTGGLIYSDGASFRISAGASASTTKLVPVLYLH
jgi:hypothetical protein